MAEPPAWTALYQQALHAEPAQLLSSIRAAGAAISARMRVVANLANHEDGDGRSELRALSLAVADLHVLRVCFRPPDDAAIRARAMARLLEAQLDLALTFCRAAQNTSHNLGGLCVTKARRTYDDVMGYLARFDMAGKEFHDVTATAERVVFILEQAEKQLQRPPDSALQSSQSARRGKISLCKNVAWTPRPLAL
jgi:hypothetical protein